MLTVNYLTKYLNMKQDNDIKYELENFEYDKNLDICNIENNVLFNNINYKFFIMDNNDSNKSIIYTIYNSILSIMDKTFYNLNENNKEIEIKKLIKQMSNDLFDKDYYKKYYYRNRKFRKINFINIFNDALTYKINFELIYMLLQYISDYIGINILVLKEKGNEYYKTKYSDYRNIPWCFIQYKNNEYNPIFLEGEDNFIKKTDKNYEILMNNINNELLHIINDDIIDIKIYENMKVNEIKEIATKINIELKKKSDKTGNMINKTKSELIDEIIEKI